MDEINVSYTSEKIRIRILVKIFFLGGEKFVQSMIMTKAMSKQ